MAWRAAEAAARRERARKAKAEATERAKEEMRAAERRVGQRLVAERAAAAEALRKVSAGHLREALCADYRELAQYYRVRVPYAAWGDDYHDSEEYHSYEVTLAEPSRTGWDVTIERTEVPPPRKYGVDKFTMRWRMFAGIMRFGAHQLGVEL